MSLRAARIALGTSVKTAHAAIRHLHFRYTSPCFHWFLPSQGQVNFSGVVSLAVPAAGSTCSPEIRGAFRSIPKGGPLTRDDGHTKSGSSSRLGCQTGRDGEWQAIFDAIPDMICVLDHEEKIRRINRSFQERMRLPLEKIIGANWQDVLRAAGAVHVDEQRQKKSEEEMPRHGPPEIRINGSRFALSFISVQDSERDSAQSMRILHDITEKSRQNERMMQSRKMESIGRLAGEIAHKINNPLLYISNYLYLLSEDYQHDSAEREYIDKIQGGVDKLTALTRDLTDFSRPLGDEFLPVNIETLLGSSLALMDAELRENKIEIIRRFGCGEHLVPGSGEKLRQAFMHLIRNAIEAMEQGGTITITTFCSERQVTIEFEDTGSGIAKENLHRIFDPFFTTKKDSLKKGVGLGLAICYNTVQRHRGDITVTSTVGTGTTFTIILPAAVSAATL